MFLAGIWIFVGGFQKQCAHRTFFPIGRSVHYFPPIQSRTTGVASSPSSSSVALKLHNTRRQKGERQTARHKNSDSSVLSEHRRKETKNNNPTRSSESSAAARLIWLRWTMEYASRVPYLIASFVRSKKVKLTLRLSDPNPSFCSCSSL